MSEKPREIPGPYRSVEPIVLASGSPRRKDLLESAGIELEIRPSRAEEPAPVPGEAPDAYARRMAVLKTKEVAGRYPDRFCLGADTVVAVAGEILGKPADEADALRMLRLLSGATHQVVTGCCLIPPGKTSEEFAVSTDVAFVQARPGVLEAYARCGEPMDKAGAYAIQGRGGCLVERVKGSYTNVVGLPLARVIGMLVARGVVKARSIRR